MRKKISFKLKTSLGWYEAICYIDLRENEFEIDVYTGYPDRWAGKEDWIAGYTGVPYDHVTRPIDEAREIIENWERPLRLERYLQMKRGIIELKDEDKKPEKPKPAPVIRDYREGDDEKSISYFQENPEELERLEKKERERLLKLSPELRMQYHEWKALDKARRRSG